MAVDQGYARPEMLAEAQWLAQRLDDPSVRVVDTGALEAYRRAHIPSAVHIGWNYVKDPDNPLYVLPPAKLADLMEQLGIGNDTTVVAYDDGGGHFAGRLWWVLDYYGHARIRILNGGWNKWLKEGRPVAMRVPQFPRARFIPRPDPERICDLDSVRDSIARPDTVILDTRSDGEYDGSNPRDNKRGGHIPGAVHIEWRNNVTADEVMSFKPAAELKAMYLAAGVAPDKKVITY